MLDIILLNALFLFIIPSAAAMFAPTFDRAVVGAWTFSLCLGLTFWGWVIFIVAHFVVKFW